VVPTEQQIENGKGKWTLAYGYTNGDRRKLTALEKSDPVDFNIRRDADFVLGSLIGDLEVQPGRSKRDVGVQIRTTDVHEDIFDQALPFEMVFGTGINPFLYSKLRYTTANNRITITVINDTGGAIEYNWLFWGYNIMNELPWDKDKLMRHVYLGGRESNLSWSTTNSGDILTRSIFTLQPGTVANPSTIVADTLQRKHPFLVKWIGSVPDAVSGDVYFNLRDVTEHIDAWFNKPVLARMALGFAGFPFMLEKGYGWRTYNTSSQIQIVIENKGPDVVNLPISMFGMKGNAEGNYRVTDYMQDNYKVV